MTTAATALQVKRWYHDTLTHAHWQILAIDGMIVRVVDRERQHAQHNRLMWERGLADGEIVLLTRQPVTEDT